MKNDFPEQVHEHKVVERMMILCLLYECAANDVPLKAIQSHMATNALPDKDDTLAASLHYLEDKGLLKFRFATLGATRLYRITAAGMDLMEREYPLMIFKERK